VFTYMVTFAPSVAICVNVVPSVERSTSNPVSLFESSVQDRLIWLDETAVAVRFVGARGLGIGVGVGVGVAVGLAVGVGVGVGQVAPNAPAVFDQAELPPWLNARTR
jgi:hypothetical protein